MSMVGDVEHREIGKIQLIGALNDKAMDRWPDLNAHKTGLIQESCQSWL